MNAYDVAKGIMTQNNRGTADPYIIVLQEKIEVATADGNGDRLKYYHHEFESAYNSKEEFREACRSNGYSKEDFRKMLDELQTYEVKDVWEDRNWFFTDEGYNQHLDLNRHNYGEVRSYLKHAFRNPEMKAIFEHLRSLYTTELK